MESEGNDLKARLLASVASAAASAPDPRLMLTDYHRRAFPRQSWRSIDVWKFRLAGNTDSPSVLNSLLHNDAYPHTFMTSYPEYPRPDVRGPFLLSRLSVDSFVPVSSEMVWTQVEEFLQGEDPPISRSDLGLDALVGTGIEDADEVFQLHGTEEDQYETGWVVAGEFREFVAINRSAMSVIVLVASAD